MHHDRSSALCSRTPALVLSVHSGPAGAATPPSSMYGHGEHSKFERRRDARLSPDDLKDVTTEQFVEIAKDKWKSR